MSWDKNLSRPLKLVDGTVLETLSDARRCLLDRFSTITHSEALAHAGELLLTAAQSGRRPDIEAATEQVHRTLAHMRLMA